MSVFDIITRADAICKRYEKFDVDKQRQSSAATSEDAFTRLLYIVETELDAALQKLEEASKEKNRGAAVTMSAEVRRTKARLLEEIPKLQRLAPKKAIGLSKDELEARVALVATLKDRILSLPDWINANGSRQSRGQKGLRLDSTTRDNFDGEYFQQSEESSRLREEYEMRRKKQEQGLDDISEGLDTLKSMAQDINEEFDRQVVLMDEIDEKVGTATTDLKTTNGRLKENVTKMRSSRNFCIDLVLLSIILGIAAYLYNVLKM